MVYHSQSKRNNGEPPVGLAPDITLSRRAQLAVLAHIRHTHTRYDQLLRETTYANARKAVEPLCLDILVKWRGDEETGRDQLDEILYEVVVISDSDSDSDSDDEDEDDSSEEDSSATLSSEGVTVNAQPPAHALVPDKAPEKVVSRATGYRRADSRPPGSYAGRKAKITRKDRRAATRAQRGFSRYQAALEKWHQAVERQRVGEPVRAVTVMSIDETPDSGVKFRQPTEYDYGQPQVGRSYTQGETHRHPQYASYGDARPIVGQHPVLHMDAVVERVRSSNQDLKDHLVKSIECCSPETTQTPPQFPGSSHSFYTRDDFPPSGPPPPHHQARAGQFVNADLQSSHHTHEQQGFITLPPRYETGRITAAPAQHRSTAVPVSPEFQPTGRDYIPRDVSVPARRQPMDYSNDFVIHKEEPLLRSEARPIWIEDDDAVRRSERRPIVIEDDTVQERPMVASPPYFVSEHHPPPVTRVHHPGPLYVAGPHSPPFNDATAYHTRVRKQPDDVVEIVRVSNKFPRRHEPSIKAESDGLVLRPRVPLYGPEYISDDPGRHSLQPAPAQHHRIERVVANPEQPQYHNSSGPSNFRHLGPPNGYAPGFLRQERVVGIEYIPVSHG